MNATVTIGAERVLTGSHDWSPGWIAVRDGRIVELGEGIHPAQRSVAGTIVPGFVDIHAHGAAGADFGSADEGEISSIIDFHARRGTTRLVATLASAPLDELERRIAMLRPFVARDLLAGIHLEGPYLAAARRGAHNPSFLRAPSLPEIRRLVDAGAGSVRMVTIAPELDGAEGVIRWLVDNGVTAAIGHTDCDAATARNALDWGATVVTHLFNGMPGLHHRDPGPVGVALTDDRATVELILDGHHLSAEVVELVRRAAASRVALVSDAMSATGCADGDYSIAGSAVRVAHGVARLAGGSSLAGSTITVADAFSNFVETIGASLEQAVTATTRAPATALGLPDAELRVGAPADLIVLDGSTISRVMRRGEWLES